MNKRYNIIDTQLGEYYREEITLGEAKECAICCVERAMLGGGTEYARDYARMLADVEKDKTFEDVAESLEMFDYELEEA